jgi:hypothetical protein
VNEPQYKWESGQGEVVAKAEIKRWLWDWITPSAEKIWIAGSLLREWGEGSTFIK